MDGTVADYNLSMRNYLLDIASPNDPELPENFHDAPSYIEKRSDLIKKQPGFWRNLPRIEAGFHVLDILKSLDYSLVVLTKGPTKTTSAWTEKRDWCHEHLPGVPVTITEDKGLVYGNILFDDFPPYIEAWLEYRPRGKVIMLDYPWNKDFDNSKVLRIKREYSKNQLTKEISEFLL
mgnify:FL=1